MVKQKKILKLKENFPNFNEYLENIERLYDLGQPRVKKIVDDFLKRQIKNIEAIELVDFIDSVALVVDFIPIKQNKTVSQIITGLGRLRKYQDKICVLDPFSGNGVFKTDNLEWELSDFMARDKKTGKSIKEKVKISCCKLLVYIIYKLNTETCQSILDFSDYAKKRKIKETQKSRNQFYEDMSVLKAICNIRISSNSGLQILDTLIYRVKITPTGKYTITINPDFVKGLKDAYVNFPIELIGLNSYKYRNEFLVGWKIMCYLMINKSVEKRISVKNLLCVTDLPETEMIKDRNFIRNIKLPFEEILDNLCLFVPDLELRFDDFKSFKEFEEGFINIKINNRELLKQFNKNKIPLKNGPSKKRENIKLCKRYLKNGKSVIEIAELLRVSKKTVNRYKKEIEK